MWSKLVFNHTSNTCATRVQFVNHSFDYRLNWIINDKFYTVNI